MILPEINTIFFLAARKTICTNFVSPFYDEKLELQWRVKENSSSNTFIMHVCSHAIKIKYKRMGEGIRWKERLFMKNTDP
jgi:hypothetical protein